METNIEVMTEFTGAVEGGGCSCRRSRQKMLNEEREVLRCSTLQGINQGRFSAQLSRKLVCNSVYSPRSDTDTQEELVCEVV